MFHIKITGIEIKECVIKNLFRISLPNIYHWSPGTQKSPTQMFILVDKEIQNFMPKIFIYLVILLVSIITIAGKK